MCTGNNANDTKRTEVYLEDSWEKIVKSASGIEGVEKVPGYCNVVRYDQSEVDELNLVQYQANESPPNLIGNDKTNWPKWLQFFLNSLYRKDNSFLSKSPSEIVAFKKKYNQLGVRTSHRAGRFAKATLVLNESFKQTIKDEINLHRKKGLIDACILDAEYEKLVEKDIKMIIRLSGREPTSVAIYAYAIKIFTYDKASNKYKEVGKNVADGDENEPNPPNGDFFQIYSADTARRNQIKTKDKDLFNGAYVDFSLIPAWGNLFAYIGLNSQMILNKFPITQNVSGIFGSKVIRPKFLITAPNNAHVKTDYDIQIDRWNDIPRRTKGLRANTGNFVLGKLLSDMGEIGEIVVDDGFTEYSKWGDQNIYYTHNFLTHLRKEQNIVKSLPFFSPFLKILEKWRYIIVLSIIHTLFQTLDP